VNGVTTVQVASGRERRRRGPAPLPSHPDPVERIAQSLARIGRRVGRRFSDAPRPASSSRLLADADAATVVTPGSAATNVDAGALVARLFSEEGASLVRLARLFTDDRNAAEDLVQEAFIRLHRSAGRIKDPTKAAPYLRSIVLNLARDHNRRGLMSLRHRHAMLPPEESPPLEDEIVHSAEQRRVVDALRDLPARQRDCLVLRFFHDLKEREIAETLAISPNSVKTHIRRGLAALSQLLGEQP
jgi:RNA polymerase sigma-70 factor (ECF subfamily)